MDLTQQYGSVNSAYPHPKSYTHLGAATPQTPLEGLNRFGNANGNTFLPSGMNGNVPPSSLLTPSLLQSDPTQSAKETPSFYDGSIFNGHCKEEQQCIPPIGEAFGLPKTPVSFQGPIPSGMESQAPQSENCFQTAENTVYPVQVPQNIETPTAKGLFGMLPHEEVMSRHSRFERNETFVPPVAIPNSATSSHNGPYSEANGLYSPANAPQSVQSTFSGDTASLSPPVPVVNSSNFSSPSDYYSSPKGSSGAYNNLQSPVPKSPSVPPHTVPTSPFGVEALGHVPNMPCSPSGTASFPSNMNGVQHHQRPTSQHSPVPNQNFMNSVPTLQPHPVQPSLSTANFSSSVPQHQGQSSQLNTSNHSQNFVNNSNGMTQHIRTPHHSQSTSVGFNNNMTGLSHSQGPTSNTSIDAVMGYGPSQSQNLPCHQAPSAMPKPEYSDYDMYGASTSYPSNYQPMYPSSCQIPATQYRARGPGIGSQLQPQRYNNTPMMNPMMNNQMGFSTPRNNNDMYTNQMDTNLHAPSTSGVSGFLNKDLPVLDTDVYTNRPAHPSNYNEPFSQSRSVKQEIVNDDYDASVFVDYSRSMEYSRPYRARRARRPRGSYTPRRRGRRGRRRKAEYFSDANRSSCPDAPESDLIHYGNTNKLKPSSSNRICDRNELPPTVSYAQYRFAMSHSEAPPIKTEEVVDSKPADNSIALFDELGTISGICLPNRRPIRNQRIRDTSFIGKFHQFLNGWSACVSSDEPVTIIPPTRDIIENNTSPCAKLSPKQEEDNSNDLKLVFVRHPKKQWHVERKGRSKSQKACQSASQLSSHKIKVEVESEESDTGNLTDSFSKFRTKRFIDDSDNIYGYRTLLQLTNFDRLSAGKVKSESVQDSLGFEHQQNAPKKRGRKRKKPLEESLTCATDVVPLQTENSDALPNINIKEEVLEQEGAQVVTSRRSSLRSRKAEELPLEPVAGPSFARDTIDLSSDEFENFSDSDSDPAWMPASKVQKGDPMKQNVPYLGKKRGPKGFKKSGSPTPKKRGRLSRPKSKNQGDSNEPIVYMGDKKRKDSITYSRRKRGKAPEQYLIAKTDLNMSTPHLWKVDKITHMLQRFDVCDQNGVLLYKESFTYAAYNEISVSNYVTAKVNIVNDAPLQHKVEYLGPNLTESVENALLDIRNVSVTQKDKIPKMSTTTTSHNSKNNSLNMNLDSLKEHFEVYIQSLISQALDNSFLSEIHQEKDMYFLSSINEIDAVSKSSKDKISRDSWNEAFISCLDTYPDLDAIEDVSLGHDCEICCKKNSQKLLKFGGQPYHSTTLKELTIPLPTKMEFAVCTSCSLSILLYNRLHHQKFNFFTKCRVKMIEVRGDSKELLSHALLERCLRDHVWINKLFEELVQVWHQCPEDR